MQKIIFLLYGVFLSSFFWGIGESFYTVQLADLLKINFSQLLVGSLVIGILSIFMLTLIFSFALLYMDNGSLRKFIIAFVAPSTAMTSFAFLLVFGSEGFHPYWTIPLVLVLLFLPVFYKLFWETKFQELEGQFEVARVLGASRLLILKRVLWPQVQITLQKSMLLMFAWATSDFAVSRILSSTEMSLAMAVDNLLGSYRLSLAFVACGYLLVFMSVGLLLIKGAFYVSRHKS